MSFPTLTLPELRKIVWMIADKIRDKGKGSSSDYMPITIGVLFLKRLLDMRAEFKRQYAVPGTPQNAILGLNDSDIDATIENDQFTKREFEVVEKALGTYRIEWRDIVAFPNNENGNTLSFPYADGLGGQNLTTSALNKFILLKECLDAFAHPKIHDIFATFNFLAKIYNPGGKENVLDPHDFETILEELSAYDFGLEHANEDIFADVYMDLLGRFAEEGGKKGGEFYTPTKVVRGVIRFLDIQPKERKIVVGDLASGACTFMVEFASAYANALVAEGKGRNTELDQQIEFFTGEKSLTAHALGDANMLLHGFSDNHTSIHANSILDYDTGLGAHCRQKVDILLANPPYGIDDYGVDFALSQKNMPRWSFGVPKKKDGEFAFLLTALDMIADDGRGILVMPLGTLFRDSAASIRERIIGKDWLEGIVELPKSMFLTTSIPVCLWIINKRKAAADHGKVFFIDASHDFIKVGKLNELQEDLAVQTYRSRSEIEGYARLVSTSEISANRFTLSVSKYIRAARQEYDIDIEELISESNALLKSATAQIHEVTLAMQAMTRQVSE